MLKLYSHIDFNMNWFNADCMIEASICGNDSSVDNEHFNYPPGK